MPPPTAEHVNRASEMACHMIGRWLARLFGQGSGVRYVLVVLNEQGHYDIGTNEREMAPLMRQVSRILAEEADLEESMADHRVVRTQ